MKLDMYTSIFELVEIAPSSIRWTKRRTRCEGKCWARYASHLKMYILQNANGSK